MKLWLLVASLNVFGLSVFGLNAAEQSDRYWQLDQESVEAGDNLYFSWLGCDSCLMLEQQLELDGFETLPLIARADWRPAAKIQIALNMLQLDPQIIQNFKQAILDKSVNVKDLNSMVNSLVELGVEEALLQEQLESKLLLSRVQQAQDKAKQYQIQYVPTLVVKGRYATDAKRNGSIDNFAETLRTLKNK